jgi:hypothetical protein
MENVRLIFGTLGPPPAEQLKPTKVSQTIDFERAQPDGRSILSQDVHTCLVTGASPFQESDLGFVPTGNPRARVRPLAIKRVKSRVFRKRERSSAGAHL